MDSFAGLYETAADATDHHFEWAYMMGQYLYQRRMFRRCRHTLGMSI